MRLSAIVVIGNRPSAARVGGLGGQRQENPALPLACAEIFGQSVLDRTVARLRKAGVRTISVIAGSDHLGSRHPRDIKVTIADTLSDRWSEAERILGERAQHKIDTVLIAEMGAYVELDVIAALQFHKVKRQPVTPLHDSCGPLGYWMVDAAQVAALGLPSSLKESTAANPPTPYRVEGHVNRLADAHDFRRLVVDAFLGRCAISPRGREIKPGVWIGDGVDLHRTARIVAPAYLGCATRVRPAAVISRFSNLERECFVGEGSVITNSSVLPNTVIGRGLDISAALVDGGELVDLRRNVTLRMHDCNLISGRVPTLGHIPSHRREHEEVDHPAPQLDLDYFQYLSRAAGRLLEVFRGEV